MSQGHSLMPTQCGRQMTSSTLSQSELCGNQQQPFFDCGVNTGYTLAESIRSAVHILMRTRDMLLNLDS